MPLLSKRKKSLSVRANEQLPIPFGNEEERNKAIALSKTDPEQYIENGYHFNSNFDDITFNMLNNILDNISNNAAATHDLDLYDSWIRSGAFSEPKFYNMNLKYLQSIVSISDYGIATRLLFDVWYILKSITPNNAERSNIIAEFLNNLLANRRFNNFWRLVNNNYVYADPKVIEKAKAEAKYFAENAPKAYFENFGVGSRIEELQEITHIATLNLATKHPKDYFEMLTGHYWDELRHDRTAFVQAAYALAGQDPIYFFRKVANQVFDFAMPHDAILVAGKSLAKTDPEKYVALELQNIETLQEVTRALAATGELLPKGMADKGYHLKVDTRQNNFMSITNAAYPDTQRHPSAAQYPRFDVSLNWPDTDPMRDIQDEIVSDYSMHHIGNPTGTKSFALIAFDPKNDLLIEEIQSDFPTLLYNMKNDNYRERLIRRGIKEEEYNSYIKQMSEHMVAYPYLMLQKLANFADQNNIDTIKISSLPSILSFAEIQNTKKAKRVYNDVLEELGFAINPSVPGKHISEFIDTESEPISSSLAEGMISRVQSASIETLQLFFEGGANPPGSENWLSLAAEKIAKKSPRFICSIEVA